MSYGKHIARNTAWLSLAMMLNKAIAFVTFALVAKLLGPHDTGVYFYAVSITSVFVILGDVGMQPVIIREIAGATEKGERFLATALRLKFIFVPIAILCSLGYGFLTGADSTTMLCIILACAVMGADCFSLAFYAGLRGKQDLRPEAIGMLIGQVFTATIAISSAWLGFGPPGLVVALLAGSLWNVGWSFGYSRIKKIVLPKPLVGDARRLLIEASPFAISGVAVKVYSYVDSLLLNAMHGIEAVGQYAVAYKMTYALQFLPITFAAALYPSLAQAWAKKDYVRVRKSFIEALRITALVGFPISAGLSALAPRIIPYIYGPAFLGAVAPFSVLPWVLLPIFMDFPVGSLLNGSHRAHLKTMAQLGTMVINVVLNVLLIPSLGPLGAAWAGLFSFWALYLIGLALSKQDAGGWGPPVSIMLRAIVAAGISWFAWREIGVYMPLIPDIIFGSAVAIALAFIVRLVSIEDLLFLLRLRKIDTDLEEEAVHEQ